jgi:IclR family transcriptional regulator, pca regulon regulatory protein
MAWHRGMKGDPRKIRQPRRVGVQSFERGLALLRAFGADRASMTTAEAAAAAGLTRAGARRLLMTLQEQGYAHFDGKRYALTPRVLELGFAWLSAQPLFGVGEPVAKRLAERLNETVSIGTLDIPDVVYVVRALSSRPLHFRLGPGTRIPAHTSSMGLILLGTLEPSQLDTFFKQWPRRRYTDRTPVEESEVRALIQAAGRDGYCYLRGVMEDSIAGLSVPVRDRTKGRAIAAINVSTSLQRTSPEEALAKLLPELRAAAQSIEAALP